MFFFLSYFVVCVWCCVVRGLVRHYLISRFVAVFI